MEQQPSNLIEICTIEIGRGGLDNDYTFYTDGTVKRYFDRNIWSLNHTEWLNVSGLSSQLKEKLLEKCPEEHRSAIEQLFGS